MPNVGQTFTRVPAGSPTGLMQNCRKRVAIGFLPGDFDRLVKLSRKNGISHAYPLDTHRKKG